MILALFGETIVHGVKVHGVAGCIICERAGARNVHASTCRSDAGKACTDAPRNVGVRCVLLAPSCPACFDALCKVGCNKVCWFVAVPFVVAELSTQQAGQVRSERCLVSPHRTTALVCKLRGDVLQGWFRPVLFSCAQGRRRS